MYEEDDPGPLFNHGNQQRFQRFCRASAKHSYRYRCHLRAFSSKDAKGDFVGFDIDLGNELCSRIKVKCTWVGSDFDSLIPSLKAKKIDAIISSLSITEKRQQEIAFSDKLYAADSRLIAPKGSSIQPTLESLKGKHVGVLQGSTQEAYGNERWRSQGVDVVAYQNQDLIYSDLAAGRLDAALQDEVAASEGFLKQPAGKDFAFAGPSVKDKKNSSVMVPALACVKPMAS